MPKLIPYHLTIPNGLHVGRGVENLAESLTSVPSDTLHAALLDTWHYLGGNVNDLLNDSVNHAFRVTSAFPFAGGVRFYPMPVDFSALFTSNVLDDFDWNKPLKRIRYLSEELLKKALRGEEKLDGWLFPKDEYTDPVQGVALQGGALWLTKEEVNRLPEIIRLMKDERTKLQKERPLFALRRQSIWKMQTVPRVAIDRVSSTPNLFPSERVFFSEGCGLWFGYVEWADNPFQHFENLLRALSENGLGGERSVGFGGFSFDEKADRKAIDGFADAGSNGYAYLLSRYHPRENETANLKDERSAYRLEAVGGWLRTPENAAAQRRKRVWMIAEGSRIAGNPEGDAPDVKPEYQDKAGEMIKHPIYRPGFAVALDWQLK